MKANEKKTEAISEFISIRYEPSGRKVLNLLDILIDETRKDNDTALTKSVTRNQGRIDAYLKLRDWLTKEPS